MQIDIYAGKYKKWAVQKSQPPAVAVKCRKHTQFPTKILLRKTYLQVPLLPNYSKSQFNLFSSISVQPDYNKQDYGQ